MRRPITPLLSSHLLVGLFVLLRMVIWMFFLIELNAAHSLVCRYFLESVAQAQLSFVHFENSLYFSNTHILAPSRYSEIGMVTSLPVSVSRVPA